MKRATTIVTFLFFTLVLSGQTVSVSADKMNIFYNGLENPFSVVVENNDCENVVVKVSKGEIKGENCKYKFKFIDSTLNLTTTKIFTGIIKKKKIKWIDSVEFTIKKLTDPIPTIDWKMISIIREYGKEYYIENYWNENLNLGIINKLPNFDYELIIPVVQYSIKILRQDAVLFDIKEIKSNRISKDIIEKYLIAGNTGDKVIVYDIFSKAPDGGLRKFEKLEYILK